MDKNKICSILELMRIAGVILGLFLAAIVGKGPVHQFSILCIWTVLSLAGLTGIESVFFGEAASQQSGYGHGGAYQRQSGFNNIALAITVVLVYLFDWGTLAQASVMTAMLVFLSLSSINHAYSAIKEGNKSIKNLMRPMMTIILLIAIIPFMLNAIAASVR